MRVCGEIAVEALCAGWLQDSGAAMLDNATVAATKGVAAASYSPSTFLYAWGTPGAFATQAAARQAFLAALSQAGP